MATAQNTRIDQRTERVERLEAQMQKLGATEQRDPAMRLWADKTMLQETFRRLLVDLGVETREPVGALELQRRMAQTGLEPNQFSRSIVEMRDE